MVLDMEFVIGIRYANKGLHHSGNLVNKTRISILLSLQTMNLKD